LYGAVSATFNQCTFADNGAGKYCSGSAVTASNSLAAATLNGCTVSRNSGGSSYGALRAYQGGRIIATGTNFSANSSRDSYYGKTEYDSKSYCGHACTVSDRSN